MAKKLLMLLMAVKYLPMYTLELIAKCMTKPVLKWKTLFR